MKLWLDDLRNPSNTLYIKANRQLQSYGNHGWTWAKTYDETIDLLKTGEVKFASLDHDIGACQDCTNNLRHIGDMKTPETTFFNTCNHAKTGYDVVCWMEENNVWPEEGVQVHSQNPVGRARMQQVIDKHYRK